MSWSCHCSAIADLKLSHTQWPKVNSFLFFSPPTSSLSFFFLYLYIYKDSLIDDLMLILALHLPSLVHALSFSSQLWFLYASNTITNLCVKYYLVWERAFLPVFFSHSDISSRAAWPTALILNYLWRNHPPKKWVVCDWFGMIFTFLPMANFRTEKEGFLLTLITMWFK